MRDLSWRGKNLVTDRPCSCPTALEQAIPQPALRCRVCSRGSPGLSHLRASLTAPPPRPGRSPAPRGERRRGRGPPPRRAGPIRRCNLRRRVTRGAESAAGRRYRLPARTPGSRLGARGPRRPALFRQLRHAGPCGEREPRSAGRTARHRRVRGGPLRERRAHAQFRHLPAGAAGRRGLQHVNA